MQPPITVENSLASLPQPVTTIGFIGTGFMKCMPITRSGRWVSAPTRVIE